MESNTEFEICINLSSFEHFKIRKRGDSLVDCVNKILRELKGFMGECYEVDSFIENYLVPILMTPSQSNEDTYKKILDRISKKKERVIGDKSQYNLIINNRRGF